MEVRNELLFADLSSDELPDLVIQQKSTQSSVDNGPFAISTLKRKTNLLTSPGMSPVTNDNLSN